MTVKHKLNNAKYESSQLRADGHGLVDSPSYINTHFKSILENIR